MALRNREDISKWPRKKLDEILDREAKILKAEKKEQEKNADPDAVWGTTPAARLAGQRPPASNQEIFLVTVMILFCLGVIYYFIADPFEHGWLYVEISPEEHERVRRNMRGLMSGKGIEPMPEGMAPTGKGEL